MIIERAGELVDRAAILDLVAGYAHALDSRDWARLRAMFAPDGVFSAPGVGEGVGPDGVTAFLGGVVGGLDATWHLVGGHRVTVRGELAEHSCDVLAQHVRAGALFTVGGRYHDVLSRSRGGWQFSLRTVNIRWTDGDPAVLAPG